MRGVIILENIKKTPTFLESTFALSLIVILVVIGNLLLNIPLEVVLIFATACVGLMAWRLGYTWGELETAISQRLKIGTPAILIIWLIGAVIASFIFSGSIPMFIYYGMKIISPEYIYASAFLICVLFSTITGSSYTSAGTAGIALMSISAGLGASLHITAAAIICGAMFGDKISPLSESTNLTAAAANVDLYDHIKSMLWTTLPAAIISLIFFFVVGLKQTVSDKVINGNIDLINELNDIFSWSPLLLLPFLVILLGAIFKQPPLPTIILSCFVAVIIGVVYQGFSLEDGMTALLSGFETNMLPNIGAGSLSEETVELLNNGGITSMVSIILVIYGGFAYTGIVSEVGYIRMAISPIIRKIKNRGPLMLTTLASSFAICLSGNSYAMTIILPEMFRKSFLIARMPSRVLSRTIEDIGTIFGTLIPWMDAAIFFTGVLGVPILGINGWGIWAVMLYITPVISIILAYTGIGIYKMDDEEQKKSLKQYENEAI